MTEFFAHTRPGVQVTHGATTFELPILYFRDDMFAAFYTAAPAAVRAQLPSDALHPVTLPGGRALVGIGAFNYVDTTIGSYGEVAVVVPCVHGRKPLPMLPSLLEARYPGFGYLVLHLPVTKIAARDAGRGVWGYTKFVSDMRFQITPAHLQCQLSEGGRDILTLRVAKQGLILADTSPLVTYSVRDGDLIRTTMPLEGLARYGIRPSGGFLELGDHPVADSLRALDLSSRPLLTRYYLHKSLILPEGEVVERSVRPLPGYLGEDRVGVHEVEYL